MAILNFNIAEVHSCLKKVQLSITEYFSISSLSDCACDKTCTEKIKGALSRKPLSVHFWLFVA